MYAKSLQNAPSDWNALRSQYQEAQRKQISEQGRASPIDNRQSGVSEVLSKHGIASIQQMDILLLLKSNFAHDRRSCNPEKMGRAFRCLEAYALNLCFKPWKKEYYVLKKYCGYYKTFVEAYLTGTDIIFHSIGYVLSEDETEWRMSPGSAAESPEEIMGTRSLLDIAFSCFVAAAECQIIADACAQLGSTCSPCRVFAHRLTNPGRAADTAAQLRGQKTQPEATPSTSHRTASSNAYPPPRGLEPVEMSEPLVPLVTWQQTFDKERPDSSRNFDTASSPPLQMAAKSLGGAVLVPPRDVPERASFRTTGRPGFLSNSMPPNLGQGIVHEAGSTWRNLPPSYGDVSEPATADEHMAMSMRCLDCPLPPPSPFSEGAQSLSEHEGPNSARGMLTQGISPSSYEPYGSSLSSCGRDEGNSRDECNSCDEGNYSSYSIREPPSIESRALPGAGLSLAAGGTARGRAEPSYAAHSSFPVDPGLSEGLNTPRTAMMRTRLSSLSSLGSQHLSLGPAGARATDQFSYLNRIDKRS